MSKVLEQLREYGEELNLGRSEDCKPFREESLDGCVFVRFAGLDYLDKVMDILRSGMSEIIDCRFVNYKIEAIVKW